MGMKKTIWEAAIIEHRNEKEFLYSHEPTVA